MGEQEIKFMKDNLLTFVAASEFKCSWNKKHALYKCACGTEKLINISLVNQNKVKSCGCKKREVTGKLNRTHGQSQIPEYRVWAGMIQRCQNKNNKEYQNYGGRGITIEWRSFEEFHTDMGTRPTPKHTIERIDNNSNYSKSNCKWATNYEQSRNKQQSRIYTVNGVTKNLKDWAKDVGVTFSTMVDRLKYYPPEIALTAPKNKSSIKGLK